MDYHNLLFYFCTFFLSYILTQKLLQKFRNLPPAPFPTLPILGHLYLLRNPSSAHRVLSKISAQYGPIVSLELGSRPALLVSSPSSAEECLSKNDIVFANRPRFVGGKILGYEYTNILWAPYGPLWRTHRRIAATEILSPHRLQLLSGIRADEVRSLIQRIIRKIAAGDQTVEIKQLVSELTNNVMMRMIAGKRFFGSETEEVGAKRFREMMKELRGLGGAASGGDFFPYLRRLGFFKRGERKCMEVFAKMDRIFQDLVDEKRKEMEEGKVDSEECSKEKSKSLIEVLLDIQKTDPSYSTDTIVKGLVQVLMFFVFFPFFIG